MNAEVSSVLADHPISRGAIVCRRIAMFFVGLAAGLSVLTTIGWMTGFHLLASGGAEFIPMAPSTALGFALVAVPLLGMLLWPKSQSARYAALTGSLFVLALAIAKLVEFFVGFSFGLEEWMVVTTENFGAVPTGRMSPITAGNFLFCGLALLLVSLRKWGAGGVMTMVEMLVTITLLIGYWYGEPLLYGGRIIPVALTTAVAFLFVGIGLFGVAGPDQWPLRPMLAPSASGLLLRAFIPVTVFLVLLFGSLQNVFLTQLAIHPAVLSAFSAVVFALVMTVVVSQVASIVGKRIDRAEQARDRAQMELRELNAQLEKRVKERTLQLRVKNAQMEDDLKMAREMQLAMLPQKFPCLPANARESESALRFFSFYYPAGAVSGDFFVVVPISETAVGIFLCDVMGHGVRAALVTAMMRALVGELGGLAHNPGELLSHINKGLQSIFQQTGTTMFATCFYAVADVEKGEIRYASGGHPGPLHLSAESGEVKELKNAGKTGPALGLLPEAEFATLRLAIAPGDLLILFTDGLFEAENREGEQFGTDRMRTHVQERMKLEPDKLLSELLETVREFSDGEDFLDDVCLIGIEIRPAESVARV